VSAESRQRALANLCRQQRDQNFSLSAETYPDREFSKRVLTKSAMLLGVIAVLLDPEPALPSQPDIALTQAPAVVYYRRVGRAFVKVKP
jgi:hypothetical protein